jgi:hypothetical protein
MTTTITKEQVLESIKEGASSISGLATRLGYKGKISGSTGRKLKALVPQLDDLLKVNRQASCKGTATNAKTVPLKTKTVEANPYRQGSMYNILFEEGSKGFVPKQELIERVANLVSKAPKMIDWAFSVVGSPLGKHQSNGGRSQCVRDSGGQVKLVAIRRHH